MVVIQYIYCVYSANMLTSGVQASIVELMINNADKLFTESK